MFRFLFAWMNFQTFLSFHPSTQIPPDCPQIIATRTLVFNPMSCTKYKPVYMAARENPSSILPPYNLPVLLLNLRMLFCHRKTTTKKEFHLKRLFKFLSARRGLFTFRGWLYENTSGAFQMCKTPPQLVSLISRFFTFISVCTPGKLHFRSLSWCLCLVSQHQEVLLAAARARR